MSSYCIENDLARQQEMAAIQDAKAETEIDKVMAQNTRLRKAIANLLLLIEHETGLPQSAANGVCEWGMDEGVIRAENIIGEAQEAIAI